MFLKFIIYLALFVLAFSFGQAISQELYPFPSQSEWDVFIQGLRGLKGMSWFVAALLGVQGLFLLFRTVVGEVLGVYRLLVLAILSVGATISVNILSGKGVIESIILDSSTLIAYQVLFHQIKRQWEKRSDDKARIDAHHVDSSRMQ